jgi:hypothetical protein
MVKKTLQESENRDDLGDAKFCECVPGKEMDYIVKGHIESCPTLLVSELHRLVGKHPDVSTVADASLVVARDGLYEIRDMTEYDTVLNLVGTTPPPVLSPAQLSMAEMDFRLLPGCPNRKLSYKLCCHSFDEIYCMTHRLNLSLNEVIEIVLTAGFIYRESVPKSTQKVFGEEFLRFIEWRELRLAMPTTN